MAINKQFSFTVSKAEWWLIIGISQLSILIFVAQDWLSGKYGNGSAFTLEQCLISMAYSLVTTGSLYIGTSYIFQWLSISYPWSKHIGKRIFLEITLVFLFSSFTQFILVTLFFYLGADFLTELTPLVFFTNILFGNAITLIVLAIVEGVYLFKRWKESLTREIRLKEENAKSQLLSLQAQIDPHFMFNSLNVLSALIDSDKVKAQNFIDDFAKVYRYVLLVKGEAVATLKQELEFSEAYLKLQQVRFGAGLQISKNIKAEDLSKYIPPLALQEVLNNAIKHNEVSLEKPLKISLTSNNERLVVSNNWQTRTERTTSTGTGLNNLKKRYQLLGPFKPTFIIKQAVYSASLPLLNADEN